MITTINEYLFTNHYILKPDERFKKRILNAEILNKNIKNVELAKNRFKIALSYYGLEMLDKIQRPKDVGFVFGNIMFKEDKKAIPAELQTPDGVKGNVYVAVVKDGNVITLLLMPQMMDNNGILSKIQKDPDTQKFDGKIETLIANDGSELDVTIGNKKRKPIIIDLDISDEEFRNKYDIPLIKNSTNLQLVKAAELLDEFQLKQMQKIQQEQENTKNIVFLPPKNASIPLENLEGVIYHGMEALIPEAGGAVYKMIREIEKVVYGNRIEYVLHFENTKKTFSLKEGITFIVKPVSKNTDTYKLKVMPKFDLTQEQDVYFKGNIKKFNPYPKGKGGSDRFKLGVIINPTSYYEIE